MFGQNVVAEDGSIDRRALGTIVFADPEQVSGESVVATGIPLWFLMYIIEVTSPPR